MAQYKNVKTGEVVEFSDEFYNEIKHQGNYVLFIAPKTKAPKRKKK